MNPVSEMRGVPSPLGEKVAEGRMRGPSLYAQGKFPLTSSAE